ncbi:MAG: hypothetical protein IH898_05150 [Planctomycetes bacterium]|nr:hypothetical protein [Planctomycetota bacterium]
MPIDSRIRIAAPRQSRNFASKRDTRFCATVRVRQELGTHGRIPVSGKTTERDDKDFGAVNKRAPEDRPTLEEVAPNLKQGAKPDELTSEELPFDVTAEMVLGEELSKSYSGIHRAHNLPPYGEDSPTSVQ